MKFNKSMITADMKKAAELVFVAMAWTETVRPIVEGYQRLILEDMQAPVAATWSERVRGDQKIITNPEHTYLMEEGDFAIYLARTKEERDQAGLHVDNDVFCPLLVAEDMQRKAERVLVEAMQPLTGISFDRLICSRNGIENKKKYLDLTLRLLAPFVKDSGEMMKRYR